MISETWAWQRIPYVRVGLKSSTGVQCSLTQNWVEMTRGSKQVWNWNVSCSFYSPWASDKVHPGVLRLPPGLTVWGGGASHSHRVLACKGLRWKQCNGHASVVRPHWCLLEVGSDHWPPHCPHLAYCDEPQSGMPRSSRSQSNYSINQKLSVMSFHVKRNGYFLVWN